MFKTILKIIKRFFQGIFALIGLIILIGVVFMYTSPQFGGTVTDEQKIEYAKTGHYEDEVFTNAEEIVMEINCHSIEEMLKEQLNPNPKIVPDHKLAVEKINPFDLVEFADSLTRATWFGHSSFLIETGGKKILLDPVFGKYAAPHPWLGRERFNEEMPIDIKSLPAIDAIIISHDHYDHLDYPSIKELKEKVGKFFVPLGVGNHLRRWEVPEEKIVEMDWWQEQPLENVEIVFTPSRHNSGRGISDQSATLWGSWIIQTDSTKIYFSGDGGYGKHFKEIGAKYGPFDLALMECGQYNKNWAGMHMMPEETAQASKDVQAELVIPVHWGSFVLATHSWKDPVERLTKAAKELDLTLRTPKIGEPISLEDPEVAINYEWWAKE